MKITFLGTGASEGIPSLFCSCNVCENARKTGGKEIRSRAGLMVNDDLLIDCSADTFLNAVRHNIRFDSIKNILVSHSHLDHLGLDEIVPCYLPFTTARNNIHIYGNEVVLSKIRNYHEDFASKGVQLFKLNLYSKVKIGNYNVVPFRSKHMDKEESMIFLIENNRKYYLHSYDAGCVGEDAFDYLKKNDVKIDCAVFDCTYGLLKEEYYAHMNLNQVVRECAKLRGANIFTDRTKVFITHICHLAAVPHEELCLEASKYGVNVAYDGLRIEV